MTYEYFVKFISLPLILTLIDIIQGLAVLAIIIVILDKVMRYYRPQHHKIYDDTIEKFLLDRGWYDRKYIYPPFDRLSNALHLIEYPKGFAFKHLLVDDGVVLITYLYDDKLYRERYHVHPTERKDEPYEHLDNF